MTSPASATCIAAVWFEGECSAPRDAAQGGRSPSACAKAIELEVALSLLFHRADTRLSTGMCFATVTTVGAASTSRIRAATCWKSSRDPTAAAAGSLEGNFLRPRRRPTLQLASRHEASHRCARRRSCRPLVRPQIVQIGYPLHCGPGNGSTGAMATWQKSFGGRPSGRWAGRSSSVRVGSEADRA